MTKAQHQINAEIRTVFGRKVKGLRSQGLLPATIYGHKFEPVSIQFVNKELEKIFEEVGESGLVELTIGDKKYPIIFRNPQYHPLFDTLVHIDCYKVNLKEKITATVPVELVGESFAVKSGNVLIEVTNEVEVEALPTDLPEKIEVDISKLENVDDAITVADLAVDKSKVEIKTHGEQIIVKIEEPRAEEVAPVEEVAPNEVPATAQKSPEELAKQAIEKKEEKEK